MKIIVKPHTIKIINEENVNKGEVNINKCYFEFSEEYTEDLVKVALFSMNAKSYKQIIINDECAIPQEILKNEGICILGIYAYKEKNEELILRYSPSPERFYIDDGSYEENTENSKPITSSEIEQYQQALNDGLKELDNTIDDFNQKVENGYFVGPRGPAGPKGENGHDGQNGVNGQDGSDGKDGYTPVKGKDYYTEEEQAELVNEVKDKIDLTDYAKTSELPTKISDLNNDSNFIEDSNYVHTDSNYTSEEKAKLAGLNNYDDTSVKEDISSNTSEINKLKTNKADKSEIPSVENLISIPENIQDGQYLKYDATSNSMIATNIESSDDEWELINTIKIEEDSGFVTCNVDKNGEHFAYKEIKILALSVLGSNSGNFGLNLYNHATNENTSTRIYTGVILANPMSNVNQKMIFLEATKKTNDNRFWIEAYHKNQTAYTVTTNQTSPTSAVADDTIRKIQIYFSSSNVCSSGIFKFYGRKKVS